MPVVKLNVYPGLWVPGQAAWLWQRGSILGVETAVGHKGFIFICVVQWIRKSTLELKGQLYSYLCVKLVIDFSEPISWLVIFSVGEPLGKLGLQSQSS